MQGRQVWSQVWQDTLEEQMATHSSIIAWKIPWTEEPGSLHSVGSQRVGHDLAAEQEHERETWLQLEVRLLNQK